jgi:hypothetical protein
MAIQLVYITQEQVALMAAIGETIRRRLVAEAGQPVEVLSEPLTVPVGSVPVHRDGTALPGETLPSVPGQRDTETEVIVGLDAAASFLGYTKEAFIGARKRAPIPGETKKGRQPAWNVVDLREWHSKRPRAGKRSLEPTEVILSKERDEASGE